MNGPTIAYNKNEEINGNHVRGIIIAVGAKGE